MAGTTVHYLAAVLLLLAAMTPARGDCVSYYKPVQDQTVHYLSGILLLLAAMTPARGDCVSYYKPVQDQTVYSVVPTTPVDRATIQAMCSTKYPGFSLLASTEITPEMALKCGGEVPLGLKRNGESVTWNMPPGIPVENLTPGELASGTLEGDGTLGAINIRTGKWRLVDSDHTFTCAICERSPKLDLHDPVHSPSRANYTFSVTSSDVIAKAAFIDTAIFLLACSYGGDATCRSVRPVDDDKEAARCAVHTKYAIQHGLEKSSQMDDGTYHISETMEGVTCPETLTMDTRRALIQWDRSTVGTVRVARNVANHKLTTRECFAIARKAAWTDVTYWEEVWQPCRHVPAYVDNNVTAGEDVTCHEALVYLQQLSDLLPVPAQGLEQYMMTVNALVEMVSRENTSSSVTTSGVLQASVQTLMPTTLFDPGASSVLQELSSLVYAVVDLQNSFNGILETSSWILDFGGATPAKYDEKDLTKTRIALDLPQEIIGNSSRISLIATNSTNGGLENGYENHDTNELLLTLFFSDTASNVSSLRIRVESSGIRNIYECLFFTLDDKFPMDVCSKIEESLSMTVFECKDYPPNGFYILRQTPPSTSDVSLNTTPDMLKTTTGFASELPTTPIPLRTKTTAAPIIGTTTASSATEVSPGVLQDSTKSNIKTVYSGMKIHHKSSDNPQTSSKSLSHQEILDTATVGIIVGVALIVIISLLFINIVTGVRKGKCRGCSVRRIKGRVFGKYKPEEGFVVHEVLEHDDPEGSRVTIHRGRSGQIN